MTNITDVMKFFSRYGDRSPITIPGRLFAISWILMGLVIISIVTGGIVTSITSVLVVQESKIYGAQACNIPIYPEQFLL